MSSQPVGSYDPCLGFVFFAVENSALLVLWNLEFCLNLSDKGGKDVTMKVTKDTKVKSRRTRNNQLLVRALRAYDFVLFVVNS